MGFLWMIVGCTGPAEPRPEPVDPATDAPSTPTDPQGGTGATGVTGDTGPTDTAPPIDPACVDLPPAGPFVVTTLPIRTEEDFDFDLHGNLVAQRNNDLVAFRAEGGPPAPIAVGINSDPAGIRALETGDFVIASPATGSLIRIDGVTGGSVVIASALSFPNGLEVSTDGMVYSTEFLGRGDVRRVDPYAATAEVVVESAANAVALSPDEDRLYLSRFSYTGATGGTVGYVGRGSDGAWSEPFVTLLETETLVEGLVTDICGNLYGVDSSYGRVFRIRVDDGVVEPIATLDGVGTFSSARFGAGYGGFSRTTLYVTNRERIYAIDLGIAGRHVLAADTTGTTGM
ncbi:MAG: hypothetical protein ABMB14_06420 [Myxococcota bacterium]